MAASGRHDVHHAYGLLLLRLRRLAKGADKHRRPTRDHQRCPAITRAIAPEEIQALPTLPARSFLRRLSCETDLRDADSADDIQHVHHALVLRPAIPADHDRKIRILALVLVQPLLELFESDRHGIEKDFPFVVHRDGFALWALQSRLLAGSSEGRLSCPALPPWS